MKRTAEPEAVAARLRQEHLRAPFPAALRGAELAGIDMALLDADTAGCVSAWLNNGGSLDTDRRRILRDCIADLDQILPLLDEPENPRYYRRLRQPAQQLTQLVGDASPRPTE